MILTARAPAKINLNLHILGCRNDGYHLLDSVVAFTGSGDVLSLQSDKELSLIVDGPTAAASGANNDNLVLRAVRAFQARRAGLRVGAFKLTKRLPVAAGIGGGSSDAAAALRLIALLNDYPIDDAMLVDAARATGADVPVCLDPRLSRMSGVGDIVERLTCPFAICAVLVNPRVAVSTPEVFRALNFSDGNKRADVERPHFPANFSPDNLLAYLEHAHNDLETPALSLAPVIHEALSAIRAFPACKLARMSGSGATVFGLFATPSEAAHASRQLQKRYPGWWVTAAVLR
ncbi:4-(cytidine 5'-diphospho)-2-C-methyl-D-erythritol kinase [Pseudochelatococcus sp. G4_1912]|uniref:4-(cytidine 5'-diphospho)-2-C-methyl-D-erythritol kinase n=1 Tax=Pseudochelatococcus sp. G4_1912 TaxID=3114288 RepID=UPI0039C675A1